MRKNLKLFVGIAIAAVILLIGLSALQQHNKQNAPVKIGNQLVSEILSNDSKDSYALFSDTAKQNVSSDDWSALVSKLSVFFKGQSPQFNKKELSGTIAVVKYTIKGSDGTYLMTATLQAAGKSWQVQSFTSVLQS